MKGKQKMKSTNIQRFFQRHKTTVLATVFLAFLCAAVVIVVVVVSRHSCAATQCSTTYCIEDDWKGVDLHPERKKGWGYFTLPDPTNGFVKYGENSDLLKYLEKDKLRIGVQGDGYTSAQGARKSIRLTTSKRYNSGLFVISADHMPEGKATWPAFWLLGDTSSQSWACNGEIDIIEGVNSTTNLPHSCTNTVTLHTNGQKCYQNVQQVSTNSRNQETISNPDCNAGSDASCGCKSDEKCPYQGCSVKSKNQRSFGAGFNAEGGGVYACELTDDGKVTVWFFEHSQVPSDIARGNPEPSKWNRDNVVSFTPCSGNFKNMQLVLNTTLCGDWAGEAFPDVVPNSKSPQTNKTNCEIYVKDTKNNKSLQTMAYWIINYVKVFKKKT